MSLHLEYLNIFLTRQPVRKKLQQTWELLVEVVGEEKLRAVEAMVWVRVL